MLTPSTKLFYAVEAVLYLSYNAKLGPIPGNEIAKAQQLPPRYLEPMMQKLVRAGVLRSVRGPQGGYILARERRNITLADICHALSSTAHFPNTSLPLGARILLPHAIALAESWNTALRNTTLEMLCDEASAAHIPMIDTPSSNFII